MRTVAVDNAKTLALIVRQQAHSDKESSNHSCVGEFHQMRLLIEK